VQIEEEMEKLEFENERLNSQILITFQKLDRQVADCQFNKKCEKFHENVKVCFL